MSTPESHARGQSLRRGAARQRVRLHATGLALALSSAFALGCKPTGDTARAPTGEATTGVDVSWAGKAPGLPEGEGIARRVIGEQIVVVRADVETHGELDQLFNHLWTIKDQGAVFRDGQPIAIGWTTVYLALRKAADGSTYFMAQEPEYDGDPENVRRDDLSATLRVLAEQRSVLERSGSEAQAVNFDQHLLTVRGALEAENVFLMRVSSPGGRMTGWRLAPTDVQMGDFEVDSIPVYELLAKRPALVSALILPDAWMAYFQGEELVALVDPANAVAWSHEGAPDTGEEAGPAAGEQAGEP